MIPILHISSVTANMKDDISDSQLQNPRIIIDSFDGQAISKSLSKRGSIKLVQSNQPVIGNVRHLYINNTGKLAALQINQPSARSYGYVYTSNGPNSVFEFTYGPLAEGIDISTYIYFEAIVSNMTKFGNPASIRLRLASSDGRSGYGSLVQIVNPGKIHLPLSQLESIVSLNAITAISAIVSTGTSICSVKFNEFAII